jgi:hypothetical protein
MTRDFTILFNTLSGDDYGMIEDRRIEYHPLRYDLKSYRLQIWVDIHILRYLGTGIFG